MKRKVQDLRRVRLHMNQQHTTFQLNRGTKKAGEISIYTMLCLSFDHIEY